MAPRFGRNMYRTYKTDGGADAVVCFARQRLKSIVRFRDQLFDKIEKNDGFVADVYKGGPTPPDGYCRLFAKDHEGRVRDFKSRKTPGVIASMLNTRKARAYREEAMAIAGLASFEVSTSHDYPCIEVHSSLHREEALGQLIEDVAVELDVAIARNDDLPGLEEVVWTNRRFDVKAT